MRWIAPTCIFVALFSSSAKCTQQEIADIQTRCDSIVGAYEAIGVSDWMGHKGDQRIDILGAAFKYSLPQDIGDPKKYEEILNTKYNWFSLASKGGVFLFRLYDAKQFVREFSAPVTCASAGWQMERITRRYLDGNTVEAHFVSTYRMDDNGRLIIETRVSHERNKVVTTAIFRKRVE